MAESNTPPVQAVQTGSFQEVQIINKSVTEGYQPPLVVRKGYQPTDTPPPQLPPQSVLSAIPVVVHPPADAAASDQATPTVAADQSK